MKNKATHKGTCQVCGATQKLPCGHLSTHGYTVNWGFFSGICQGTGALPFEQDKSLVEGAIARAKLQLEQTKTEQARLRAPVTPGTTQAWFNVYFPYRSKVQPAGYQWHLCEVTVAEVPHSDGDGSYTQYTRGATRQTHAS